MSQSVASVRASSVLGVPRPTFHSRRGLFPVGRPAPSRRLDLRAFRQRLEREGVSDRLPDLELRLAELSDYNRRTFGFGFDPGAIRVPERDLPSMVLGLREGILTRPLVIDSPRVEDVIALGIDLPLTMLRYRLECLERSGIAFVNRSARWELWSDLRRPWHGPLSDRVRREGTLVSADDLPTLHGTLPPPVTIGERLGAPPRLLLVGPDQERYDNPLLATGLKGAPVIRRMSPVHSASMAFEERCRFLGPEAALLLLGAPDVRERVSTLLGAEHGLWLSALDPLGRVAMMRSRPDGIELSCEHPRRCDPFDRLPASSE